MIALTAAEVIGELQRLPPHTPVWIECERVFLDGSQEPDSRSFAPARRVAWEGSMVILEHD